MADELVTIKRIKVGNNEHEIDATYLGGKTYQNIHDEIGAVSDEVSAVRSIAQGAIETYVIPSQSSPTQDYKSVVRNANNTISTTKTKLTNLIKTIPGHDVNGSFKVGDVILMEEVADPTSTDTTKHQIFDRWISAIDGENFTLTVLETQVATHHHTISIASKPTASAVVSVGETATVNNMAYAGVEKTVVTGVSSTELSSGWDFITSVAHSGGSYSISAVSTAPSDDDTYAGHSHTVNSHTHSISVNPSSSFVSEHVSAYTTLNSAYHIPHSHTNAAVAGPATTSDSFKYVTGGSRENFIKSLKYDTEVSTTSVSLTTDSNAAGVSTDVIGTNISTSSSGSHSHSLSSGQTADVVVSAVVADKVITDASITHNVSVAPNVVTSIVYASQKVATGVGRTVTSADFFNSCSVNASGVLSFGVSKALTDVTVSVTASTNVGSVTSHSSATQSAGTPSLTLSSVNQTVSVGKVAVSGTTNSKGAHTHTFDHSHTIPTHTHTIANHNHIYKKAEKDGNGDAYTTLTSDNYTPHTHTSLNVASTSVTGASFKYITDGSTTNVVKSLKNSSISLTTTSAAPSTNTVYYDIDIIYPGLSIKGKKLSTDTIKPAVDSGHKVIKSVNPTTDTFVQDITLTEKTSENKGGK
jgi:hypothetical protein